MFAFAIRPHSYVDDQSRVYLVLGFVLGIHATGADHVVAISTIVSSERRIESAAWIGALQGAGHTLTILQ